MNENVETKMIVDDIVDVVTHEPTPESETIVYGKVVNCAKLNVRAKPDIVSNIVTQLHKFSEVIINLDESTSDWYKVVTEAYEGYCMAKYIEIQR